MFLKELVVFLIGVSSQMVTSAPADSAAAAAPDDYSDGCAVNPTIDTGLPETCAGVYCTDEPTKRSDTIERLAREHKLQNREDINVLKEWQEPLNITGADDCQVTAGYEKPYFVREFTKQSWTSVVQTKDYQQLIWTEVCLKKFNTCFGPAENIDGSKLVCFQEYASVVLLVINDDLQISRKQYSFPSHCSCKTSYEYGY